MLRAIGDERFKVLECSKTFRLLKKFFHRHCIYHYHLLVFVVLVFSALFSFLSSFFFLIFLLLSSLTAARY